jgi:hypothetical protein
MDRGCSYCESVLQSPAVRVYSMNRLKSGSAPLLASLNSISASSVISVTAFPPSTVFITSISLHARLHIPTCFPHIRSSTTAKNTNGMKTLRTHCSTRLVRGHLSRLLHRSIPLRPHLTYRHHQRGDALWSIFTSLPFRGKEVCNTQ